MSTIIAHSFIRSARPIPLDVARLLLCAILSDTVSLTSPTTTLADRYIVPLLSRFCGETDHNRLSQQLFKAKTAWFVTLSPFEVVRADQKNFTSATATGPVRWGWATVEVTEPSKLLANTELLLLELHQLKLEAGLQVVFLSIVDLADKRADLLLPGPDEVLLAQSAFPDGRLFSPALNSNSHDCESLRRLGISLHTCAMDVGGLISRKKQFKPAVDNALAAGWVSSPVQSAHVSTRGASAPMLTVDTCIDAHQNLQRTFSITPKSADTNHL